MKSRRWLLRNLSLCLGLAFASREALAEAPRFRLAYVGSYQDVKVYGPSDQEAYQAGRSHRFRPFGMEGLVSWGIAPGLAFEMHGRVQRGRLRFQSNYVEQDVWDAFGGLGLKTGVGRGSWGAFWMFTGARWRTWETTLGIFPTSHQLGGYIGFIYGYRAFETEVEAGLMSFGFGPVALGKQRDSSTLRVQARFRIPLTGWTLVPGLDFLHTHRSQFASMLDANKQAFFVDDMRFGGLLAAEF